MIYFFTSGGISMKLKSLFASMLFLLAANFAVAAVIVTCANPNQSPAYNVGSTSSNNVPVGQCYLNTVGECLYNLANPASGSSGWNTGCPSSVAGSDCCRWKQPVACNPPSVSVPYPFTILATNPVAADLYAKCKAAAGASVNPQAYKCCVTPPAGPACNPPSVSVPSPFTILATNPATAGLYAKCKAAAGASANPQSYKCCVEIPKDPCEAKGLFNVKGEALNIQGQGVLCCSSKNPKEEMIAGKKVCCELVKPAPSR